MLVVKEVWVQGNGQIMASMVSFPGWKDCLLNEHVIVEHIQSFARLTSFASSINSPTRIPPIEYITRRSYHRGCVFGRQRQAHGQRG